MPLVLYPSPNTGGAGGAGSPGMPGVPGVGYSGATLTPAGHLVLARTDGTTTDVGELPGFKAASLNGTGQLVLTTLAGATVNLGTVVGPAGAAGAPGAAGATGLAGPAGAAGAAGATGSTGPAGAPGAAGAAGPAGADGKAATITVGQVATLAAGAAAIVNNVGTSAAAVLDFALPTGPAGAAGVAGPAGPAGATGQTGPAGPAGVAGPAGPAGVAGPAGPTGQTGATGATGATGPAGATGATGPAGATGATGPSVTLTIGTVSTLSAGTAATATLTGTSPSYTLNLGIPAGYTGKSVTAAAVSAANVLTFTVRDNVTGTDSTVTAGTITVSGAKQIRGPWSASATYVSGDVVSYLGSLYQATADLTASATFQSASFTRLTNDLPSTPPSRAGLVLATNSTIVGDNSYSPVAAAIAGAWTAIPLAGATTTSGTDAAQFRVLGDAVELRGRFTNVTAANQQVVAMGTLPAGTWPPVDIQAVGFFGNGVTTCGIQISASNGNVAVYTNSAVSAGTIYVHGIRFSITPVTGNTQPAYSATFLTTQPTTWTTLAPTAGTQGSPPLQYRYNGDRVELRGYVTGITAAANSVSGTIATLPVGYRPVGAENSTPAVSPSAGKTGAVSILSTGELRWFGSALSSEAVSFNGVEFSVSTTNPQAPTGAVGTAWTPLTLTTGTVGTVVPAYRIVGDEVQLRGYVAGVSGGTTSTAVATLPSGFRPPAEVLVPIATGSLTPIEANVSTAGVVNVAASSSFTNQLVSLYGIRFSTTA